LRRSERSGRRIRGIHDDQGVAGERCRPPVREKQRIERLVIFRGSFIIRVEYPVPIEKPVHCCRDTHAAL
jgi:hypothetical protein